MRKVCLGGLVYKEEIFSLPDKFDAIYDRFIELDNKDVREFNLGESEEYNSLAKQLWKEVCDGPYSSSFDTPLVLESGDGKNIIWED